MPHSVDIPKTKPPEFPNRCIECGKDGPDSSVSYASSFSAWKPLREPLWKEWNAEVPVCSGCVGALRRGKWLGRLVFGVGIAVALGILFLVISVWPSLMDRWTGYVVILAAIAGPMFLGQFVFTPSIDFSGFADRLSFDFRDADYAEEFARINDSVVK